MSSATSRSYTSTPAYQKWVKNLLFPLLGLILLYNSLYFKKLSTMGNNQAPAVDFSLLADSLYFKAMSVKDYSLDVNQLLNEFTLDADQAMETHGNRLGIGQSSYFMVTVDGQVKEKTPSGLEVVSGDKTFEIDTKYVFGNAIRDASGLVKLTDFKTNASFNKLSESLNSLIREQVLPEQLAKVEAGDKVLVTGAIKLSKKQEEALRVQAVKIQKSEE